MFSGKKLCSRTHCALARKSWNLRKCNLRPSRCWLRRGNASWALFLESVSYIDLAVTFAILTLIVGASLRVGANHWGARDTSCYWHWNGVGVGGSDTMR